MKHINNLYSYQQQHFKISKKNKRCRKSFNKICILIKNPEFKIFEQYNYVIVLSNKFSNIVTNGNCSISCFIARTLRTLKVQCVSQIKFLNYQIHNKQLLNLIAMLNEINMIADPEYRPSSKKTQESTLRRKIQNLKLKSLSSKSMRWDDDQNKKYANFLIRHKLTLQIQDSNKRNRIFSKMALVIRSRKATQCRSHHQKMIQKHKTIENIITWIMNSGKQTQIQEETPLAQVKQEEQNVHEISIDQNQQSQSQYIVKQQHIKEQAIENYEILLNQFSQEDIYHVLDLNLNKNNDFI